MSDHDVTPAPSGVETDEQEWEVVTSSVDGLVTIIHRYQGIVRAVGFPREEWRGLVQKEVEGETDG